MAGSNGEPNQGPTEQLSADELAQLLQKRTTATLPNYNTAVQDVRDLMSEFDENAHAYIKQTLEIMRALKDSNSGALSRAHLNQLVFAASMMNHAAIGVYRANRDNDDSNVQIPQIDIDLLNEIVALAEAHLKDSGFGFFRRMPKLAQRDATLASNNLMFIIKQPINIIVAAISLAFTPIDILLAPFSPRFMNRLKNIPKNLLSPIQALLNLGYLARKRGTLDTEQEIKQAYSTKSLAHMRDMTDRLKSGMLYQKMPGYNQIYNKGASRQSQTRQPETPNPLSAPPAQTPILPAEPQPLTPGRDGSQDAPSPESPLGQSSPPPKPPRSPRK